MDLQDLNVAVEEIRGNVDRNTGRIKDLEMKTLDDKIDGMQTSVNSLTAKPAKNWDALVKIALTALVSGLVGWALSKIL